MTIRVQRWQCLIHNHVSLNYFVLSSCAYSPFNAYCLYCRLKGSDRLCSMQCCGKLLSDSFETYYTFYRSVHPEFERKFDVQNSIFGGGYVFRISFLKSLNNDDIKCKKYNMSQINPNAVFHNTAYSVQLLYIAGHSLWVNRLKALKLRILSKNVNNLRWNFLTIYRILCIFVYLVDV